MLCSPIYLKGGELMALGDERMSIVNAFTCTGAYAVLIMSGLKRVENRSMMPVPAKGRCAMSVSKKFGRSEYENLVVWLAEHCDLSIFAHLLRWEEVKMWPGHIVGVMDYDAMDRIPGNTALAGECRVWNEGYPNWWLLSNIRRLPAPVPCRGNVGMWRLPSTLANEIESQFAGTVS